MSIEMQAKIARLELQIKALEDLGEKLLVRLGEIEAALKKNGSGCREALKSTRAA